MGLQVAVLGMVLCLLVACGGGASSSGQASAAPGAAEPTAVPGGTYGSGLNVDSLANTPIGQAANFQVSYRIRANHTGALQGFRPMFIWSPSKAGYAAGTGGTIQIQLQSDDGSPSHNPSGTVLATMVHTFPVATVNTAASDFYPELAFNSQPQLQAGTLYHVVFTNIDADPTANWVCLDSAYMDTANSPNQPTIADTDLQTLWRMGSGPWSARGGSYTPVESFTPILELDYADGASQGQGYMEFWVYDAMPISGAQGVRETFTVSGADRTVVSVAVRLKHVSGSGPLTISLERGDGTLIDQQTVAAASVPVPPGFSGNTWVQVAFAAPRSLAAGQSYQLALSAPADTVYSAYPMRKGSDQGFKATTVFPDGHAEFNPGTGWVGWTQWGVANRSDSDLQFYFQEVQSSMP